MYLDIREITKYLLIFIALIAFGTVFTGGVLYGLYWIIQHVRIAIV